MIPLTCGYDRPTTVTGQWNLARQIVRQDSGAVFSRTSGSTPPIETMRRVTVDLRQVTGKEIFIRVVDRDSEGWGHINFDDFRFHK